jgi:hypothetical protein
MNDLCRLTWATRTTCTCADRVLHTVCRLPTGPEAHIGCRKYSIAPSPHQGVYAAIIPRPGSATEQSHVSVTSTAIQTNDLGDQLVDAVLGIDAAWTLSRESRVALIARRADRWDACVSRPATPTLPTAIGVLIPSVQRFSFQLQRRWKRRFRAPWPKI